MREDSNGLDGRRNQGEEREEVGRKFVKPVILVWESRWIESGSGEGGLTFGMGEESERQREKMS